VTRCSGRAGRQRADPDPARTQDRVKALTPLATVHRVTGNGQQAARCGERALRLVAPGDQYWQITALLGLAQARLLLGDDTARVLGEQAGRLIEATGFARFAGEVQAVLASTRARSRAKSSGHAMVP
jgi:hypothetical protein